MTELQKLQCRYDAARANGLSDMKFHAGRVSEATPESFAREANLMWDAIEAGKAKPFRFNDSRFKQL